MERWLRNERSSFLFSSSSSFFSFSSLSLCVPFSESVCGGGASGCSKGVSPPSPPLAPAQAGREQQKE